MIIGITGGTGCGKTTALQAVLALGGKVLDCDAIYHRLLLESPPLLAAIEARFPGVMESGALNRKKLGSIVFADGNALRDLNEITHAAVKAEVLRLLEDKPALAAIDAIGLFEGGLSELCDFTVNITAPYEMRLRRLMARDNISQSYARSRMDAQRSGESFRWLCDYTLENNTTRESFYNQCLAFFREKYEGGTTMTNEELKEKLLFAPKNGFNGLTEDQRKEMNDYCRGYMAFMDACKTEREATAWTEKAALAHGFVAMKPGMEVKPGDKVYMNNRDKSIILAVIGSESLAEGANICAAHVDSPRMDLKPNPLYEENEIAYFKTHYYGGIKKYQWVTVPLALHGVVYRKDGSVITVTVGEDDSDPILMVSDLLIHLSADQMQKPAAKAIEGEQLNVILGTEPLEGEGSDLVKLNIMKLLNEKYGIIEEDFLSAELTIVPAGRSREVGLDRSLIGAYGHDDRVCAYAEILPLLDLAAPKHTAVCILADKEEIGSVGISGMQSHAFEYFMGMLCDAQNVNLEQCFAKSFCLSADVSNALDPNFPGTCDARNNSKLNYGVAICKYTGSRGKGGASDASAEAMGHVRTTLDNAGVKWQIATLGKVDQGGGGTVAAYMANRNIVTVDAGVPVLCMHAPLELVSKLDCYMTMLACKAIYLA
ncbi:MAG: aminopeptidase [Faecousia sp.]